MGDVEDSSWLAADVAPCRAFWQERMATTPPRHQSGADNDEGHDDEHQEDAPQHLLLLFVRRLPVHCLSFV
jgi:hypothetical protein